MAATSFMRTWQDFDLIQLVILPMFLFSGTFFPLDGYPDVVCVSSCSSRRCTTAWSCCARCPRRRSGRTIVVHIVYLARRWAARTFTVVAGRLDKLLCASAGG